MSIKQYRLIDANYNRAKEGLRVVEDICRFMLDDKKLTQEIKKIRDLLTKQLKISEKNMLRVRDSQKDVGKPRDVPNRKNTRAIFFANIKRAQEALRVLEEFLFNGSSIKDLRYRVYDLEKLIYLKLRVVIPFEKDVYVVSDQPEILIKAVKDGAAIIQLRDKSGNKNQILKKAQKIKKAMQESEAIFIVNDYPEIAIKAKADGVHLGQDYVDIKKLRKRVGNYFIIGRTTHALGQALQAQKNGANYVSIGPVFATPTKPGRTPVGLSYVREAAANIQIPFVTIGGIDFHHLQKVLDAGATTVGIVRAAGETKRILQKLRNYNVNDNY